MALLLSYKDCVVEHVWISEPRAKLKLVNHGGKVMPYPTQAMVNAYVDGSCLSSLYDARYTTANKGIMNTFIERWDNETSSFHLLLERRSSFSMLCHVFCIYLS